MRVTLAIFLLFSILAGVYCEDDTEDPDYERPHLSDGEEEEQGEEGGDDAEEGGGDEGDGDGDGDGDDEGQLNHYEDQGETVTEAHMRTLHKKIDTNKDNKISVQEVMDYAEKTRKSVVKKEIGGAFDEMDSTKDGHMTLDEHLGEMKEFREGTDEEQAHQLKADTAKFHASDANKDGKLDQDELTSLMHPDTHPEVLEIHTVEEMRKRDTNKDGKLSKEEWTVDATPGEHQAHDPDHKHDPDSDFDKLDEDKSGFISMDELRHWESGKFHTHDAVKKLVLLADKDHDGLLTDHELAGIVDKIDGHDAHAHILDWVFHEEL